MTVRVIGAQLPVNDCPSKPPNQSTSPTQSMVAHRNELPLHMSEEEIQNMGVGRYKRLPCVYMLSVCVCVCVCDRVCMRMIVHVRWFAHVCARVCLHTYVRA